MMRPVASILLFATLLGSAAHAQTRISAAASESGTLTQRDSRMYNGAHFDLWTYSGIRGERIVVTLRSVQFDAFLLVQRYPGGSNPVLGRDDDGGSGSDARIELTLPETDDYLITVTSTERSETGAYRLTVRSNREAAAAPRVVAAPAPRAEPARAAGSSERLLTAERTVIGTLNSSPTGALGTAEGDWRFPARQGETITLEMESGEFDSFLTLYSLGGQAVTRVAQDDNSGGGLDSKIVYRVPATGDFVVRAERRYPDRSGSYTLSLRTSASPSRPAVTGEGARPVLRNSTVRGNLDNADPKLRDGTPYETWTYVGRAGESIRITLRSNDFDAFLSLGTITDGVFRTIESADDGAGGHDSRIEVVLPFTGEYTIRANALSPHRRRGSYTLRIDSLR